MTEHEDIRRQIDALPGLKEKDLGPCVMCSKPIGLIFYRVQLQQAALEARAVERRVGLGKMMGGHEAIARAFSPDEDLAKIMQSGTCLLCDDCAAKLPVIALMEVATDD